MSSDMMTMTLGLSAAWASGGHKPPEATSNNGATKEKRQRMGGFLGDCSVGQEERPPHPRRSAATSPRRSGARWAPLQFRSTLRTHQRTPRPASAGRGRRVALDSAGGGAFWFSFPLFLLPPTLGR